MEFKPNYKTEDGLFEVMLDMNKLNTKHIEAIKYWVSKDITSSAKITVYNTKTKALSQKSIYYNKTKGFYFKSGFRYYGSCSYNIKDLVPVEDL